MERPVQSDVVEAARRGDHEAFEVLATAAGDRLFALACLILRDRQRAEDAVQEALVNAWRELPRLRSGDRFDSWLDQILVNACRSLLRRSRRVQVREIDLASIDVEDPAGPAAGERDAQVVEVDLIRRAFDRLDADTRSLLVLHYIEERPLAEIARVAGRPVGTIKWRLSNARKALDRALEVERR
jgi:RNA polymerase sigma-70 factor (ECF subfamily)